MSHPTHQKHQVFKGLFMALGVYICYIFLNIFNQKMHKYPYIRTDQSGSDYFREEASMNCLTSLLCTIIGFTYHRIFPPKHRTNIPYKIIGKQAALMFTSSCLVNKSLNYLSFVVMSMIKSCSMISVVVVGIFFTKVKNQNNKMSSSKIIVAALVVGGTLIFQITGNKTIEESIPINQAIGFVLLFISIIADGLLPDYQAHMKETYHPTAMEHYQQSHRYLFLIAFIVSALSGGLSNVFHFWYTHNNVFYHCICYMISGSLGHIFIFGLIRNFSQLMVPLVLALRKMISVIISVLWFQHILNIYQYVGVFLVFSGAIYEALDKPRSVVREIKQQTKGE